MFICQTPGCAIAISKATFPTAMPCPVCQNILVEEVKEELIKQEDKDLISFLPYLIAYPLEKTLKEEHAWTKVNLLKDTLLNYLKFLGLITVSEFFNSPLKDKNIISSFYKNLSSPSFGSWNAFIRETLQFLNENSHDFFCPELKEYYVKVETGKKRKLYNGEIEIIDARGDVVIKKQQATAIGMLINFRNRYLGHGLTLDKPTSEKLWEKYYPIFQNLLMGLDWCNNYIIYKNEGKNTWKLQGASINQVEVLKAKDNIWLQNKKEEKMDLVPFFIVPGEVALNDHDTKLLVYESYTGKSIKFFSPEGIDKTTSGRVLESLNLIIKDKQEEKPYLPAEFTADILKDRIEKENQFVLQTLIDERKVIKGIYQTREDIEIKLRSWVGGMANVFFIAAEAGSGKTNLLVEIQRQYKEREFNSLLIRACRMAKRTIKEEIAYLLNIDSEKELSDYKALNQTQEKPLFVLIDGINESQDEQDIWKEIKEISKSFDPGVIKFVVSCRVNGKKDLDRFELADNKDILYSESKDEVKQLSDAVFWLTPLNMVELEGAWNTYTSKNKKTTNPQFKFNDIADYDRSIYEKIKNPLILRIFLETYHNKPLPKKGKKKLHIWRDWFKSFKEEEKNLLKLFAKKVWQKDTNELELEDLLNDTELEPFVTDDKVNAPYSRLIALGWLSRFTKQNTIYIGFTVEGLLFYLLALHLNNNIKIDVKQIEKWLKEESVIKKSAVESYLIECSEKDDIKIITDLIDHGEKTIEITTPALTEYTKTYGAKKTIDALFNNPTDLDWLALIKLIKKLSNNYLLNLRKEILLLTSEFNSYKTINELKVAFEVLKIETLSKHNIIVKKIIKNVLVQNDLDLVKALSNYYFSKNEHQLAIEVIEKYLSVVNFKNLENDKKNSYFGCYINIAKNISYLLYDDTPPQKNSHKFNDPFIWIDKAIEGEKKYGFKTMGSTMWKILFYNATRSYNDSFKKNTKMNISISKINLEKRKLINETLLADDENDKNFKFSFFYDQLAETYFSEFNLNKKSKNKSKAKSCYEKAIKINKRLFGNSHPETATSYNNFGNYFFKISEYDLAILWTKKSLEIKKNIYGKNSSKLTIDIGQLADIYLKKGMFKDAKKYFFQNYTINKINYGDFSDETAKSLYNIADLYRLTNEYDNAIKFYKQSYRIFTENSNKIYKKFCEVWIHETMFNIIKEGTKKNYIKSISDIHSLLKSKYYTENETYKIKVIYFLGTCYKNIGELNKAYNSFLDSMNLLIKHHELKKIVSNKDTSEKINDFINFAKEIDMYDELPKWIKEFNDK